MKLCVLILIIVQCTTTLYTITPSQTVLTYKRSLYEALYMYIHVCTVTCRSPHGCSTYSMYITVCGCIILQDPRPLVNSFFFSLSLFGPGPSPPPPPPPHTQQNLMGLLFRQGQLDDWAGNVCTVLTPRGIAH